MNRKQRFFVITIVLACVYLVAYIQFRQTHIQVWERDGMAYVIFPEDREVFYYIFSPLTFIDSVITGMRFQVGPHQ